MGVENTRDQQADHQADPQVGRNGRRGDFVGAFSVVSAQMVGDDHAAANADKGKGDDEEHDDLVGDTQARHRVVAEVADHQHIDRADQDPQALLDENGPGQRQQRGAGGWGNRRRARARFDG